MYDNKKNRRWINADELIEQITDVMDATFEKADTVMEKKFILRWKHLIIKIINERPCATDAETIEFIKDAMSRQIGKPPLIKIQEEMNDERYFCPDCGREIGHTSYCSNCGQSIKWEEV